jgi:hypothetical protein
MITDKYFVHNKISTTSSYSTGFIFYEIVKIVNSINKLVVISYDNFINIKNHQKQMCTIISYIVSSIFLSKIIVQIIFIGDKTPFNKYLSYSNNYISDFMASNFEEIYLELFEIKNKKTTSNTNMLCRKMFLVDYFYEY